MATEYELKYRATPAVLAEIDRAFPVPGEKIAMETTYYDTPDGVLSAHRYTLRKRLENGIAVCTLKVPAGNARGEWETECDSIEAALPRLYAIGAPKLQAESGLTAVCGAKFNRIAKTIALSDCLVELALDQGALTGGGKEIPLCEVEVELKSGSQDTCDAFARELATRFSLVPENESKFCRAMGLHKGE